MQWLLTSHVRRYHKHYGGSGHVWQGRSKRCPVQRDEQWIAFALRLAKTGSCRLNEYFTKMDVVEFAEVRARR